MTLVVTCKSREGYGDVRMTGLGKINALLGKSTSTTGCRVGYTCDNSKWNECIPMGSLVVGITVVMKRLYRDKVMSAKNLKSILNFLGLYDWMYKNKHVTFGEGISIGNKYGSYRETDLKDLDKIPEGKFKEKLKEIYPLLQEESFMMSRGMIMGMANKASTLAAYFVTKSANKLQSSDDSCAVFSDHGYKDRDKSYGKAIFKGQLNCLFERLGCMNHSKDKSYYVSGGEDMEYNSLYIQNGHLINTAVDLPGLSPVGRNYINDQSTILKNLREMISKGTTPIEAVPIIINISEEELRKVYHNTPFEGSLHQVESFLDYLRTEGVLDIDHVLPCHGGRCIISPTSLHLDEMMLGMIKDIYPEDYVRRFANPRNATSFCAEGKDMVVYSTSTKKIVNEDYTSHGAKTMFRQNKSCLNSKGGREALIMAKTYQKTRKAIKLIAPETDLTISSGETVTNYCQSRLLENILESFNAGVISREVMEEMKSRVTDIESTDIGVKRGRPMDDEYSDVDDEDYAYPVMKFSR